MVWGPFHVVRDFPRRMMVMPAVSIATLSFWIFSPTYLPPCARLPWLAHDSLPAQAANKTAWHMLTKVKNACNAPTRKLLRSEVLFQDCAEEEERTSW